MLSPTGLFEVGLIRYDGIRKKGESHNDPEAGAPPYEMLNTNFTQGAEDIVTVLDWLQSNPKVKASSVVLLTFSFSGLEARIVLRDEVRRRQVDYWVACLGTPEFRDLMVRINCGLDFLEAYQLGIKLGVMPVLGNLVNVDAYVADGVVNSVATLEQAREDMRHFDLPITWIYGQFDNWVKSEFIRDVMSVQVDAPREVISVPIGHNARTSKEGLRLFGTITSLIHRFLHKQLPAGLLAEHRVNRFLIEFLSPAGYASGGDFDRLPIPFRAVATDLGNGEMVVLGRGDLARAVRASMSIPLVFPPVEWEGRPLVDGLVVNNLPVDVGQAFASRVLVAIDIGSPALEPEDYSSALGIATQVNDVLTRRRYRDFAAEADVLVRPDMGKHSSTDYSGFDELIAKGYEATKAAIPQIRARLEAAGVDVERVVHVRVVDQSLPADRRARLLEVDAHQHEHRSLDAAGEPVEPGGIFARGRRVVDRARPDDHEQPRILPIVDPAQRAAAPVNELLRGRRQRQVELDLLRRGQQLARDDVDVLQALLHRTLAVEVMNGGYLTQRYMEVRTDQSSGKKRSSSALVR